MRPSIQRTVMTALLAGAFLAPAAGWAQKRDNVQSLAHACHALRRWALQSASWIG